MLLERHVSDNTHARTHLLAKFLLVIPGINGNGVNAHGFCVLLCQRTQPATGTDYGHCLPGSCSRLFQALVYCDPCAEDGGDLIERNALGDMSDVSRRCHAVLLEGPINGVAGELGSQAKGFIGLLAEGAGQAGVVQPLDTDRLTDLADVIGDQLATGDNNPGTLVTTDKREFGGNGPVPIDRVEIGVADARVFDVDEDILRAGLGDGNLLVLERATDLVDDLSPLLGGNLLRRHGVVCKVRGSK